MYTPRRVTPRPALLPGPPETATVNLHAHTGQQVVCRQKPAVGHDKCMSNNPRTLRNKKRWQLAVEIRSKHTAAEVPLPERCHVKQNGHCCSYDLMADRLCNRLLAPRQFCERYWLLPHWLHWLLLLPRLTSGLSRSADLSRYSNAASTCTAAPQSTAAIRPHQHRHPAPTGSQQTHPSLVANPGQHRQAAPSSNSCQHGHPTPAGNTCQHSGSSSSSQASAPMSLNTTNSSAHLQQTPAIRQHSIGG